MLLGFISGLTLSHHAALLAGTAFVGAYTTFSTWMFETHRLAEERQFWPAAANIVVSVVARRGGRDARRTDRRAPVSRLERASDGNEVLKLTAYLAERERAGGRFVTDAMLDLFAARGVATSVLLRGIASFGPRNIVRTDESLSLSEDLPVTIAAVDTPEVIGALIDDVVATDRPRPAHPGTGQARRR